MTIGVVLAFPDRPRPGPGQLRPIQPLKVKNGEQLPPPPPPSGGRITSPAELKRIKDLSEKDAEGNPIVKEGEEQEGLEGAESYYHSHGYGYYPSYYYPSYSYYPSYYYPSYSNYWW